MTIESTLGTIAIEANLKPFLLVLSISLGVATMSQMVGWFRGIPYTLLLVIAGLSLAFVDVRLADLSPELILLIFLPPLLFEASWNLKWSSLKQSFVPICLFAIGGVLLTIAGIALGLQQFGGLSIATALLIGASLAATDPVSVTALFRSLGVGPRLTTLMEGESLFNDGIAVVAFSVLLGFASGTTELTIAPTVLEFFKVVGIGVGVGVGLGFGISYLTQRFDLPLVEQSLTLVSAYSAYLIVEDLGGSGVIGVVITGLILGNFGSRIGMSPRTRIIVSEFWEFLSFFVNSIVFLLIGDQIRFESLAANLPTIGLTIAAMILSRAIAIFSLSRLSDRLVQSEISLPEQTILWWGGLRGAVSIALALSVPETLPNREAVIATVFGTVLFTLLVQGLTIQPVLQRLQLLGDQPLRQQYLELSARQVALQRVLQYLNNTDVAERPGIEPEFQRYQVTLVSGELSRLKHEIDRLQDEHPNLREFIASQFQEELRAIEAGTYAEFVRIGRLNQELSPLLELELENKPGSN